MPDPNGLEDFEYAILADRLGIVSLALILVYAITVSAAILPPRLLDPSWQLRSITALLDAAAIPLMALGLLHLAAYLDPANERLQKRRQTMARLAIGAVLGFLLIIPLQGSAAWKSLSLARANVSRQKATATRTFADLRQAIETSTSPQDLRSRLQALQGPVLRVDDFGTTMPETKQELLTRLDEVEEQVMTRLRGPDGNVTEDLARNTVRVMLSAAALALAFAACAQRRGSEVPLLVEWHTLWVMRGARKQSHADAPQNHDLLP